MSTTAQNSPALQACLDAIAHEFRHTPANHMARQWIGKSFGHPETRARFASFTARFVEQGYDLELACRLLRIACAAPRVPLITRELHLILRWMRARKMHVAFAETVAAMRPVRVIAATSIVGGQLVVCVGDATGPVIERFPRTVAGHRAALALVGEG